jgi:hypothetical protein
MAFVHRFLILGVLSIGCVACDHRAPAAPSGGSALGLPGSGVTAAVFTVTFGASPSCADRLPADARVRRYGARLFDDGRIEWSGADLRPPSGHRMISSGHFAGDSFSLVIGTKEDPQSDAFHGLWDVLGGAGILNISGSGTGTVEGARISGTLAGDFNYYKGPEGTYCSATDHLFTMIAE